MTRPRRILALVTMAAYMAAGAAAFAAGAHHAVVEAIPAPTGWLVHPLGVAVALSGMFTLIAATRRLRCLVRWEVDQ